MAVSAVIQSAARLERGRTLNNVVIIHGSGWTQLDQIGSVRSDYPVEGAAALGFRAGILRSSSGMK